LAQCVAFLISDDVAYLLSNIVLNGFLHDSGFCLRCVAAQ
jgi:hypothetical protein